VISERLRHGQKSKQNFFFVDLKLPNLGNLDKKCRKSKLKGRNGNLKKAFKLKKKFDKFLLIILNRNIIRVDVPSCDCFCCGIDNAIIDYLHSRFESNNRFNNFQSCKHVELDWLSKTDLRCCSSLLVNRIYLFICIRL
jgi:hypothetical protein